MLDYSCKSLFTPMHTDFAAWLQEHDGQGFDLHETHINSMFVKVLCAIGFDRKYVRGEGAISGTMRGTNISICSPAGAFLRWAEIIPKIKSILKQLLDMDLPNLVRMDCSLLSGLARRGAGPAYAGFAVAGFLHQQRHGNRRGRDQIRPLRDRPAGHRLLRSRVSRADDRVAVGQRRRIFPRAIRRI